jgi:hypothetical protein
MQLQLRPSISRLHNRIAPDASQCLSRTIPRRAYGANPAHYIAQGTEHGQGMENVSLHALLRGSFPYSKPRAVRLPMPTRAAATAASPTINDSLRTLYPAPGVVTHGYLQVSDIHSIYYEVHGNPHGVPAVVVHGGPGAGCFNNHA